MMQHELEERLGHPISTDSFEVIEECYMYFDYLFPSKDAVASYYKKHDLNFFELLLKEKTKQENKTSIYKGKLAKVKELTKSMEESFNIVVKKERKNEQCIKKIEEIFCKIPECLLDK